MFERYWDRAGVFISALCLVHCLLLPLIPLLLASSLPAWTSDETLHPAFTALALVSGLPVFRHVWRHHSKRPSVLATLGSGMALAAIAGFFHRWLPHSVSDAVMIVGSALLVTGHALNWKSETKSPCGDRHSHPQGLSS